MTAVTGTKPHPIFLAGRWVESPDPLVVANPARYVISRRGAKDANWARAARS